MKVTGLRLAESDIGSNRGTNEITGISSSQFATKYFAQTLKLGDRNSFVTFMEEFLTTVVLVCFNFALDVKDTVTHETRVPAYYEVEKSDNITEARRLPYNHLHNIQ